MTSSTPQLWRQPEFLKLWVGQAISLLGTQVTAVALALTAAVLLEATPAQMGLIGSLNVLPFVLFGLPVGVWVDRVHRRPVLIATDLGRALLLASVPLAAVSGILALPQLYVVSFGMGTLSVAFRVAYGSYLPSLVSAQDLAEGNAKLALAEAIARVAGPGLAGTLVQVLTAPIAILVDCVSYVISAISVGLIRRGETPARAPVGRNTLGQLRDGFLAVFNQHLLRPLFVAVTLGNLADGVVFQSGLVVLLMTRSLNFDAATVGVVLAGLGIGGLIGALAASSARRLVGIGPTTVCCLGLWAIGYGGLALVIPSDWAPLLAALLLGAVGAINPLAGANVITVRQFVTPQDLLGRVTAVAIVGSTAALTLGAFAGGVVANQIGIRPTLLIGGLLPAMGMLRLLFSPVRDLHSLDALQSTRSSASTEAR